MIRPDSTTLLATALASLLVLAGCSAAPVGPTGDTTAVGDDTGSVDTAGAGQVTVYVSDQPNAMDQFESLNVTITEVGFYRVDANATNTSATDATDADAAETAADDEMDEDAAETDDVDDADGEWITVDVDNRTVDLTEYRGENATRLVSGAVPNGTYDKVYVRVSTVEGRLTEAAGGGSPEVKLPSQTLKINDRFVVGDGEELDFVFDITVVQAGNSGMYIIKPVVSESGADQPFRTVDDDRDGLGARFVGPVTPGALATVEITAPGGPVANATVTVNDERIGTTGGDGTISFTVPENAEELEVEIEHGDREAELERGFGDREDRDDDEADESAAEDERPDDAGPPADAADAVGALAR